MRDSGKTKRAAFSLVELLVVIAIIAILAGVLVGAFGRSGESARAAKCMANLRQLAQGANSIGMEQGYYPLAGSVQTPDISNSGVCYKEYKGWISWLSKNDAFGAISGARPTSIVKCESPKYTGFEKEEDNQFVITNGTMWRAVNMNQNVYLCPTHVINHKRANGGQLPLYSYAMNGYFGYDYSKGAKAVGWGFRKEYGALKRADKILMFAELPLVDPVSGRRSAPSEGPEQDAVLQVKKEVYEKSYGTVWSGTAESIGFNHKRGNKGYCGHVAFADGHVEAYAYGTGSGLKTTELTELLCNGRDVAFDGKGYKEIEDND